jgi:hypothetical protein
LLLHNAELSQPSDKVGQSRPTGDREQSVHDATRPGCHSEDICSDFVNNVVCPDDGQDLEFFTFPMYSKIFLAQELAFSGVEHSSALTLFTCIP